jgi:hypothetical protein
MSMFSEVSCAWAAVFVLFDFGMKDVSFYIPLMDGIVAYDVHIDILTN